MIRRSIGRASLALTLSVLALTACGAPPTIAQPGGATETVTTPVEQTATAPAETAALPTATAEPTSTASAEQTATAETAAPATAEPATTAPAQTGAAAECAALQSGIATIVPTEVAQTEAPLEDFVTGATLQGCQLSAAWTGAQQDDFVAVSQQTSALLAGQGWTEDQRYVADGPTGTVLGFTKDGLLAILTVDWRPGPAVQCPADRPIMECAIPPEQRLYTLTLKVANTGGDAVTATPVAPPTGTTPAAGAEDDAIEAAVQATSPEVVAQHTVQIQQIAGDWARVQVRPETDATLDPTWAFLQRQDGGWQVVGGLGSDFGPDFYLEHGIPETIWISNTAELAFVETAYTYVQEERGMQGAIALLDRIDGNVARVRINAPDDDPAFVFLRQEADSLRVLGMGASFDAAFYAEHAIPASLQLR